MSSINEDVEMEWEALEAIYGDAFEVLNRERRVIRLAVQVSAPEPAYVSTVLAPPDAPRAAVLTLPPIYMISALPESYPESGSPKITLDMSWAPERVVEALMRKVDLVLKECEGDVALFALATSLHEDTWQLLHADDEVECGFLVDSGAALETIREWDNQMMVTEFRLRIWACGICFEELTGTQMYRLHACGHVYCRECLAGSIKVLMGDGAVKSVLCPTPTCRMEIGPAEVHELVPGESAEKFESLQLTKALDTFKHLLYCPREGCKEPFEGNEEEPRWGHCPKCGWAFCAQCKLKWHGGTCLDAMMREQRVPVHFGVQTEESSVDFKTAIMNLGKSFTSGRPALQKPKPKPRPEAPKGVKNVTWQNFMDELAGLDAATRVTQPCPNCGTGISKNGGCSHMHCTACNHHFTWKGDPEMDIDDLDEDSEAIEPSIENVADLMYNLGSDLRGCVFCGYMNALRGESAWQECSSCGKAYCWSCRTPPSKCKCNGTAEAPGLYASAANLMEAWHNGALTIGDDDEVEEGNGDGGKEQDNNVLVDASGTKPDREGAKELEGPANTEMEVPVNGEL